jgi:hypothetical protein
METRFRDIMEKCNSRLQERSKPIRRPYREPDEDVVVSLWNEEAEQDLALPKNSAIVYRYPAHCDDQRRPVKRCEAASELQFVSPVHDCTRERVKATNPKLKS